MTNVTTIIEVTGGWDELQRRPLRLEVLGFMPLVVEAAGTGPRGGTLVSVTHYHEQAGDLMCDPEMVFEILDGDWSPVTFRQDNLGLYQEVGLAEDGGIRSDRALLESLRSFARVWDRNLAMQGFVDAALAGPSGGTLDANV